MVLHFTQSEAWKKAMQLASAIHHVTKDFPREEKYCLVDQMRRASVSIAANIAEGFGRFTYPDKLHKYVQARGELTEVMTFLYHSQNVGYLTEPVVVSHIRQCEEVYKILNALIRSMRELRESSS